ncbi:peroxiredoxin [Acrasis kona]|uniref:Peroxiredoxin n=1 Tax=Acrasis kona TaxID=1008807 RepID=A0AAW2YXY4_9EUKA
MTIEVGQTIPDVKLYEGTPGNAVQLGELVKGKKIVIFGVPGAFTPGCSKTHLPGYVSDYQKYKDKSVDEIVCVSVNDPFVMAAWGESNNAQGKVRMLADSKAELTKALGLELDLTDALGGLRMKRFSAVVEDGVVKHLNVEPTGGGLTCSLSNEILKQL